MTGASSASPQLSAEEIVKGRIVKLVVNNFKSYGGVTEIGPFRDFTSVVGPNGAGARPRARCCAPALG